jgi:hypothetical protein
LGLLSLFDLCTIEHLKSKWRSEYNEQSFHGLVAFAENTEAVNSMRKTEQLLQTQFALLAEIGSSTSVSSGAAFLILIRIQ